MDFGFAHSTGTSVPSPAFAPPRTMEVASWYTADVVDGFGDRLLMFDSIDTEPLEVLRFRPEVSSTPLFEEMLRHRVKELADLTHPAFPTIRRVHHLESDNSLALVSTHTTCKRLSAFLSASHAHRRLTPPFVTAVVRQILEGLSVLASQGHAIAHSALTPDRILLMPGGRIRITEHVLGSALAQLRLPRARMWRDFGLLVPSDYPDSATLDERGDVFQAAIIGLTMLRGRRLTLTDVDLRLTDIVDQWSESGAAQSVVEHEILRAWFERALHIAGRPYRSAAEACEDLRDLASEPISAAVELLDTPDTDRLRLQPRVSVPTLPPAHPVPTAVLEDGIAEVGRAATKEAPSVARETRLLGVTTAHRHEPQPAVERVKSKTLHRWIVPSLTATALLEGVAIALLLMRPSAVVSATGTAQIPPAPSAVERLLVETQLPITQPGAGAVEQESRAVGVPSLVTLGLSPEVPAPDRDDVTIAIERAARNQRSGGVRLSAPIELKVFQGERVIGSSADGPIVMTAGTHVLDLTNSALGFRTRQPVTFRAGEITAVTIPIPTGRISINAQPWAEVWIDERPIGETPLANVDVPIGEHQIVYRHPQFGERRQSVIVRADGPARASIALDR